MKKLGVFINKLTKVGVKWTKFMLKHRGEANMTNLTGSHTLSYLKLVPSFVIEKRYFLRFFLDVTLSILGSFTLDVTLLFWVITSLYLSPITCSHGALLFSTLSISLLSKNYLGVRYLKSVTSNKTRRKYKIYTYNWLMRTIVKSLNNKTVMNFADTKS